MFNTPDADPADPFASAPALSRMAAQTLAEQLAERFASRIRDRLLAPGARLPANAALRQRYL
jgi:DNA-binding FadR family transcriptional regulator